ASFWLRPLRRPQHGATAFRRTAAAGVDLIDVGWIVLLATDLVVVTELLAGLDVAHRVDEHAAVLDDRLAVALALVIDETRVVAADASVDHGLLVHDEQEGVVVALVVVFVALVRRLVRHAIPEVFDHARALTDRRDGEYTAPVHRRIAH